MELKQRTALTRNELWQSWNGSEVRRVMFEPVGILGRCWIKVIYRVLVEAEWRSKGRKKRPV